MARRNSRRDLLLGGSALMATAAVSGVPTAQAQQRPATPAQAPAAPAPAPAATGSGQRQPNILFIMGDDVGWANIRAFNRGLMSTDTPNLDRLAADGMLFTDYYAEASCTAGRANFITGELPIRTGLTTVGQAGSALGMPAEAPTIATVLRSMGYTTGQFGKNHLGDRNPFLPTMHGFDEFFGYLYHLDAMEDPFCPPSRKTCGTGSGRATWCAPSPPTWTIRLITRAGAASAASASWTRGPCRRTRCPTSGTTWRPSTKR